ncbi:MAG: hypothetical protein NT001_04595 [Candidatus Woesearchaeota archaeon]|nr:hypothetical protein [Candidatus Woesearchaeota archaeon]
MESIRIEESEEIFRHYTGIEPIALHILLNHVPKEYKPGEDVLAMAVGHASTKNDGMLIREFHKQRFGIQKEKMHIVGCDCEEYRFKQKNPDVYDLELFGPHMGEASSYMPWRIGLNIKKPCTFSYDFILVNNPDFVEPDNYIEAFKKAYQFLSANGIIIAMSAECPVDAEKPSIYGDVDRLDKLCKRLIKEENMKFRSLKHLFVEGSYDYGFACIQRLDNL